MLGVRAREGIRSRRTHGCNRAGMSRSCPYGFRERGSRTQSVAEKGIRNWAKGPSGQKQAPCSESSTWPYRRATGVRLAAPTSGPAGRCPGPEAGGPRPVGGPHESEHDPGLQVEKQREQEGRQRREASARSVDGVGAESYFRPEWAVAGSHVIEPTGPMMGPNAVADVMPPGGRQTSG